jgi:hypothetical protein
MGQSSEMNNKKFIGKIAVCIDSKKLGKIIDIQFQTIKNTEEKKFYLLILIQKPFRKDVKVLIEANKVTKIDTHYVWFDITQKEFKEEQKKAIKIQKFTDQHEEQFKIQPLRGAYGIDITGLVKKPKEGKR